MRAHLKLGTFSILLGVLISACSADGGERAGEEGPAGVGSGTLVVGHTMEPAHYNYYEGAGGGVPTLLEYNIIEPLLERLEDDTFKPLLAESFEISEDGREYVFTLRQALFHDGTELSADDVVYSLGLAQEAAQGGISDVMAPVETIEKVDDRTVRVTLSEPSQKFLTGMSQEAGLIIPEGGAEQLNDAPVGTGPFVFEEWRNGVDVTLSRFDDYWGESPYFAQVTWRFIADANAMFNALQAGDIDLTGFLAHSDLVHEMDATEGLTVREQPRDVITFMQLNADSDVFADERVQQAVAHAIDREELVEGATVGLSEPACAYVNPPNVPWGTDHCPYPYDPERAQELLAEAGVQDLTLEMMTATLDPHPVITEIITSQLADVGILVESRAVDVPTWLEEYHGGTFEFTHMGTTQQIDAWTCNPDRPQFECVPEVDELLAEADASVDRSEWGDLRRQAVELYAEEAPSLITLYTSDAFHAMRDDLGGFKPYRSHTELDLRGLYLEEDE